jgi:tubulin polyglutamylase TTLL6/13
MNDGKSRCFEILGFDVLIDENLHPWLIEVNCMPSFTCDSPFDTALKFGVIKGALKVVDLNPNFKRLVLARQRAVTQKRISGTTSLPIPVLFDPELESEIAKTTQWRQVYPLPPESPAAAQVDESLRAARDTPVGGAIETAASRARKEAVLAQMKEKEAPAKPPRPRRLLAKAPLPPSKPATVRPRVSVIAPPVRMPRPAVEGRASCIFQPCYINEEEERERIRTARQQTVVASACFMLWAIERLLEETTDEKWPRQLRSATAVAKQPRRTNEPAKQVIRSMVTYRQIMMTDNAQ